MNNCFYQSKRQDYYGGYTLGFGIRNIKWLPTIWFWFSDWRKDTIITDKNYGLQIIIPLYKRNKNSKSKKTPPINIMIEI